jgi:hypothetical protein
MGANLSAIEGLVHPSMPAFVGLAPDMGHKPWADAGQAGFLGVSHSPFKPSGPGKSDMVLDGISLDRLADRRGLLSSFDRMRRSVDSGGAMEGMDSFSRQAFGILTSSKLANALDLEQEDPALRDRYGRGPDAPAGYGDAGPLKNDYLLAARRLVEAGVRVVSLAYGRWDWHGRPHGTNFENARDHLPRLDQGVSALLDDLHERGMEKDVSVIVWGEFGRTPRVNAKGGRDHWPRVGSALLFGGGMRTGQVIGATNHHAEHAVDRPVHFQEVFGTLYKNVGIDINSATIKDFGGRPRYLIDHDKYQPLPEV